MSIGPVVVALISAMTHSAHSLPSLDTLCSQALDAAIEKFQGRKLARGDISLSVARLPQTHGGEIEYGDAGGAQMFYPASTCKLFFLAYGAHLVERKQLVITPEAERAFTDMIVDSDNDATAAVMDLITGTTSGPELSESQLKSWLKKRLAPTNWFLSKGYEGVYVPQKTYASGPYGREQQGRGANGENRNKLCANAATRLLAEIMTDRICSVDQCDWMRSKLRRKIPADDKSADSQAREFIGGVLPSKSLLWSKAGWTSTTRHDIAAVQFPGGQFWVISVFTQGTANASNFAIIPWVARQFFTIVGAMPKANS